MKRLLCLIGWHDWHIAGERDVEPTDVDNPVFFTIGGVDYLLRCPRCKKEDVIRKRGVWTEPNYPREAALTGGKEGTAA